MQTEPGRGAPHELDVAALRARARTHVPAGSTGAAEAPEHGDPPNPRGPTTRAAVLAGAAGLVLAGLWVALGRPDAPGAAPAASSRAATADWAGVLGELDRRRARAFAQADSAALAAVYAPASAVLAEDRARMAALRAEGLRGAGLRLRIDGVAFRSASAGGVDLTVVDRLGPYALTDRTGAVRARAAGRGAMAWRVHLVPARDGGWLIAALARHPPDRHPGAEAGAP